MKAHCRKFLHNDDGATAIEYALIASLVSIAIVTAMYGIRGTLQSTFSQVAAGFYQ